MELMLALLNIVQGIVSSIMNAAGFGAPNSTVLPAEIVTAIEDCGFFESIPLWAVTLIGGLFIWVLSFVMILSVYRCCEKALSGKKKSPQAAKPLADYSWWSKRPLSNPGPKK